MIEWISVKDRLPDKDMWCICHISPWKDDNIRVLRYGKNLHLFDENDFNEGEEGFYMYSFEFGYYLYNNVTHWMPLPEPPEGE